jgi:hypothetical protein
LVTEIFNTRSLAKLQFVQIAPTVLTCPFEVDHVLERLRAAGLAPVAEDASGTVIVENRGEHRAESTVVAERARLTAAELAKRLVDDPLGERAAPAGGTFDLLAELNPRLDDAELTLLAHAVDHQDDVVISYNDKNGSHSVRQIRPSQIYGRWLGSFCYLRNADREFTIANIESVAPAH